MTNGSFKTTVDGYNYETQQRLRCQAGTINQVQMQIKPDSECDMKCESNEALACGGEERISVYKFKDETVEIPAAPTSAPIDANEQLEEGGPYSLNSKKSV